MDTSSGLCHEKSVLSVPVCVHVSNCSLFVAAFAFFRLLNRGAISGQKLECFLALMNVGSGFAFDRLLCALIVVTEFEIFT